MAGERKGFLFYKMSIFASMYLGYTLYILVRKSFTFAMPAIIESDGLDKDDLGLITSSQMLAYTISKFLSGLLVDTVSPKLLFSSGLFLSAIVTLAFTVCDSVWLFACLWFVCGLCQGLGWPSCAKILRQWYLPAEFGTFWSLLSTSMNLAGSMGPLLATYIITSHGWRTSLTIPAVLCLCHSVTSFATVHNSPSSVGLENIIQKPKVKVDNEEEPAQLRRIDLLRSPLMWVVGLSYMLVFMLRTSALDWGQLYLIQERKQSRYMGSVFISSLEVGGIIGALTAGILADKLVAHYPPNKSSIRNPRMLVAIALVMGMIASLHSLIFYVTEDSSEIFISGVGCALGFCIYGPVALYGVMAIEAAPPEFAGTSHAIACLASNIGAVSAGLPLSYIAKYYSWTSAFFLLEILIIVVLIIGVLTLRVEYSIGHSKVKTQ